VLCSTRNALVRGLVFRRRGCVNVESCDAHCSIQFQCGARGVWTEVARELDLHFDEFVVDGGPLPVRQDHISLPKFAQVFERTLLSVMSTPLPIVITRIALLPAKHCSAF